MIEENWEALGVNMDFLIAGLDTYYVFELKGNLSDSTILSTGDPGKKSSSENVIKVQLQYI